ncbi:MAG: hypothetical protein ABJM26_15600 [Anderseniella sp.]
MLWKTKSPLQPNDEDWQLACWRWLFENFNDTHPITETPLIQPNGTYFPSTNLTGHTKAQYIFELVTRHMRVPAEGFKLVPQQETVDPRVGNLLIVQNAPASPAGTFQLQANNELTITYDPAGLDRPVQFIATLAHEVSHALLFTTRETPPGGDDCEEFATDLAVTYFGFGLFGANSAFEFRQFSDMGSGMQGWETRRLGYLTEAEWSFSLAVFLLISGRDETETLNLLKPGPAAYLKKSFKYLRKNQHLWHGLECSNGPDSPISQ